MQQFSEALIYQYIKVSIFLGNSVSCMCDSNTGNNPHQPYFSPNYFICDCDITMNVKVGL